MAGEFLKLGLLEESTLALRKNHSLPIPGGSLDAIAAPTTATTSNHANITVATFPADSSKIGGSPVRNARGGGSKSPTKKVSKLKMGAHKTAIEVDNADAPETPGIFALNDPSFK